MPRSSMTCAAPGGSCGNQTPRTATTLMRNGRPDRDRHHHHRHEHAQPGHSAHRHRSGQVLGGLMAAVPDLDPLLDDANVPIEKISRLVVLADTTTTETSTGSRSGP